MQSFGLEQKRPVNQEQKLELKNDYLDYYSKTSNDLLEMEDAQYNIKRTIEFDTVIRDSRNAYYAHDTRISFHKVDACNFLLRTLGRVRGIDYALKTLQEKEKNDDIKQQYQEDRKKLYEDFTNLYKEVFGLFESENNAGNFQNANSLEPWRKKLKEYEIDFNSKILCDLLHDASLDEGCQSPEDYNKLLCHYRDLSALIDPVKTLVTISCDQKNKVTHRITQIPITQKTEKQKEQIITEMSEISLFPNNKNFHTSQNIAMQIANQCFAELAADDKRMMGSQSRKTHLHSLKNAYLVKNELLMGEEKEAQDINTLYFVRSATPVYVGKSESAERIQVAVNENFEQVRMKIKDFASKIHFTCLVTDSLYDHQDEMVKYAETALKDSDYFSYCPVNMQASVTVNSFNIDSRVPEAESKETMHLTSLNSAISYRHVADLSRRVQGMKGVINMYTCASGQDRTETAVEYATQVWIKDRYKTLNLSDDSIEETRAMSRNSAKINTHLISGSPGCKRAALGTVLVTHSDNLFSSDTNDMMYLDSAMTNKSSPVNNEFVESFYQKNDRLSRTIARAKFWADFWKLTGDPSKSKNLLQKAAKQVALSVDPYNISSQEVTTLARVFHQAVLVATPPAEDATDAVRKKYLSDVTRLGEMVDVLHHKSTFKKICGALLFLCGAALVAAGIFFAIPSGGSSLLAVILGVKAIGVAFGALGVWAAGVGVAGGVVGTYSAYKGKKLFNANTKHGVESESKLIDALDGLHTVAK